MYLSAMKSATLLSFTEENYLKAIYSLTQRHGSPETSTSHIAEQLSTKPSTVTDMLRKLADKKLIAYEKYRKIELTKSGKQLAILVIRKHRLWEVFLHEKLQFGWDEVHEIAEQLEHIQSEELITRLEKFLGFPKFDPHGDPIPSATGELQAGQRITLSDVQINKSCEVVGVNDSSAVFLKYLQQVDIGIGTIIKVLEKFSFDGSITISLDRKVKISVSKKFADNLMVVL